MNSTNAQVGWWRPTPPPSAVTVAATGGAVQTTLSIWAFRALVVFAAVNITAPQTIFPALAPFRIAFLAGGAALVAYLGEVFTGQAPDTPRPKELTLGLALFGWAALTLPLSRWPTSSLLFLTDQFLKSIIIYWLLARVLRTSSQVRTVFWTLTLISVPPALTGILQQQSGELVAGRITGYSSGLTANPNDLAAIVDLVLPMAVTVGVLARRWWIWLGVLPIVGLHLICLGATYSRAGFLGLTVMIVAGVMLAPWRARVALVMAVALVVPVAVAVLPASYVERLSTISNVESDDTGSAQSRKAGMIAALEHIIRHPLTGAGLAQDGEALAELQNTRHVQEVHNAFLVTGVDLGLPGFAIYVGMIYAGYRRLRRIERESRAAGQRDVGLLATGLRISYLGLITTQCFSPTAYNFPTFYLLGLVLALDVARAAGRAPVTTQVRRA